MLVSVFIHPFPLGKTEPRFLVDLLDDPAAMNGESVVDGDRHKGSQIPGAVESLDVHGDVHPSTQLFLCETG